MKKNETQKSRAFARIAARELPRADLGTIAGGAPLLVSYCGGIGSDGPAVIDDCTCS
ncbi:hypothetical protein [Haliangium sp.]|uniref:hypothetical protein n=1 Tax=Haliangium sp. TaxID=2663208 RepID=UPI003D0F9FDD